jgi:hypothetical protein
LYASSCYAVLEADRLFEDEEHGFPQEKKLSQPFPQYNCMQHFFYDEFIKGDLECSH